MNLRIRLIVVASSVAAASVVTAVGGTAANSATVAAHPCSSAKLTVQTGPPDGTAGTTYFNLRFINHGAVNCSLRGVPLAQPVTGTAHRPIGPPTSRMKLSGRGGVVTLRAHGGAVNAAYGVVEAGNFTPSKCVAKNSNGVDVSTGATTYYFRVPTSPVCTKLASTTIAGFTAGR